MAGNATYFGALSEIGSTAWSGVDNLYFGRVKNLYQFFLGRKWETAANMAATLLLEPINTFRAAYLLTTGLGKLHLPNLNPTVLTEDQKAYEPVLLIHGDSSNSGLFAPMIARFKQINPQRPIFTIDLTSQDGKVSAEHHLEALAAKVKEIVDRYPPSQAIMIAIVGHSSGGDVIPPLAERMRAEMGPFTGIFFKIGSVFKENVARDFDNYPNGTFWEILGTKDVFEGSTSYLKNKLIVVSGHLGLLFNATVLSHVCEKIEAWDPKK